MARLIQMTDFVRRMQEDGYVIFPHFVGYSLMARMLVDMQRAYILCRKVQIKNGLENTQGTVHHLIGLGESFMEYLQEFEKLDAYAQTYFGGKYILNSFGGNLLTAGSSYANRIHRDIRSFSGELPLMLNTLVMLDDFTKENGATWIMPSSHKLAEKPSEEEFSKAAIQVTGSAGTVVMFNSNLWHAAGENKTTAPRRSLTPMFTRPFYKPQYDYPRALGYHLGDGYSPYMRQILGYNSRIPKSLGEWYRKPEERMYRGDQG